MSRKDTLNHGVLCSLANNGFNVFRLQMATEHPFLVDFQGQQRQEPFQVLDYAIIYTSYRIQGAENASASRYPCDCLVLHM